MTSLTVHAPIGTDMALLAIGLVTGLATMLGGLIALRIRSSLDLVLGFCSGAVIGVALFDLLPEALELGRTQHAPLDLTTAMAVGFAAYFLVDRLTLMAAAGGSGHRGHIGAGSLTLHSFMDGLGIGLAFQVSAAAGVIVAFAVLAHDLVDGVNTVTLSLFGGNGRPWARRWLLADATAPLVGIGVSRLFTVPPANLAIVLALFAGFFLYIGASELLPQSHERRPRVTTIIATCLGLAMLYTVVKLAGG